MISSHPGSRQTDSYKLRTEQRFLTDGFYLWAEHQSSGLSGARNQVVVNHFNAKGKWNCFLTKMQDSSCGNSSVCLQFSHGAYRRARARPFDTRGLIRVRAHSRDLPDIYKYLVCYRPAPASPPTLHINTDPDDRSDNSPTTLYGLRENCDSGTNKNIKTTMITIQICFMFPVSSDHQSVGRGPGDNLVLWSIYINVLNRSKSVTWPSL